MHCKQFGISHFSIKYQLELNAWRRGEPNDHDNEDCGSMYQSKDSSWNGYWNDINCDSSQLKFICEKPNKLQKPGKHLIYEFKGIILNAFICALFHLKVLEWNKLKCD